MRLPRTHGMNLGGWQPPWVPSCLRLPFHRFPRQGGTAQVVPFAEPSAHADPPPTQLSQYRHHLRQPLSRLFRFFRPGFSFFSAGFFFASSSAGPALRFFSKGGKRRRKRRRRRPQGLRGYRRPHRRRIWLLRVYVRM